MLKSKSNSSGQSLLEAVIAIGISTMVLVSLITAVRFALANAQYTRNKTQATKYTQEAVEWLRSQRDLDWATFYTYAQGSQFCLNDLVVASLTSQVACASGINITGTIFTRSATLTASGADKVLVNVIVTWMQSSRTAQVTTDTYLVQYP
ncbi:MAG: hypothetical protein UV61_C0030G0004 [Candidatus Gottesmanbacteria bacterium GW2011_GWB1_43_11]|uniref:Uncharacterized protein n=1 Tax=Candidatus Gottesmanbacteria bacterium GW2011_GWB1_43_11 TaxID=1618446 RepID=A0A0G1CF26_9BACT|nr:MAG: hypothetical protein UV17_C0048G0002 [Candidatus Gottesmanbacteria bacterium GW2011_GWA1_42_26]KKS84420.1 MAG: hypothetical protein UV61_C0030G0004 [Candidatus Gottesmanbacteria bacterium GW2011_GWB1_43_11]OGG08729.1 MAG: hypothetical protein A2699_04090 [Candidatus Gottesmanbacteria bacterium RIFCSPHIGHO2_01_FULL_43_15]HCM37051.1 hypothetical protein [Patescibacteria group bacterium]